MSTYECKLKGNKKTDTFPWAVINTKFGTVVDYYTHHSVADAVADSLNIVTLTAWNYNDEIDDHINEVNKRLEIQ